MQARELRDTYLRFFESKGALRLPSDSLVSDDPTLLFTVAGMVPFKAYFEDRAVPPRPSVATSQKCLRTVDIDDIGDISHCTFFEMLGNFSFGDYFKKEAIHWAWEFLFDVLKLDLQNIRVTVFQDDDTAYDMWRQVGMPAEQITRLGEDKNYWPANAILEQSQGPCGPCSEIFFDLQPEQPFDNDWRGDGYRWLEIWNLVFTQFTGRGQGEDFQLIPLPKQNIDTGMGLERTAAAINRLAGPFETDVLRPIIAKLEEISGETYRSTPDSPIDIAFRRIADHARAATFLLSDGVTPDRTGRGYVLRRLMRRAVVAGIRKLGFTDEPFLDQLIPTVVELMRDQYPELVDRQNYITGQVRQEERQFRETLASGLERLDDELASGQLSGARAFYLYQTFGLPFEVTREVAEERGVLVDRDSYEVAGDEHKSRSKSLGEEKWVLLSDETRELLRGASTTRFSGYTETTTAATILGLLVDGKPVQSAAANQDVEVILDTTPFYAEAGGQIGDCGQITSERGTITIADTHKQNNLYFHQGTIARGVVAVGDRVSAQVDTQRRRDIMRNHTATHLLHRALRERLGTHVQQRGSLVAPDRLRFDFAHGGGLTPDEMRRIESDVNQAILSQLPVEIAEVPIDEARNLGAMMLFGEKYGDIVRVVSVGGDFSREFCGGTHVGNSAQIGPFRLISEGSAAAGVRRIEALTGRAAEAHVAQNAAALKQAAQLLNVRPDTVPEAIERLQAQIKTLQNEVSESRRAQAGNRAASLAAAAEAIGGVPTVVAPVDGADTAALAALTDDILDRLKTGVVVLGAAQENGKVLFAAKVAKDVAAKGAHAGEIVKAAAQVAGGGGGGRPEYATAGGKDAGKLADALAAAKAKLREQLENGA